VDVEEEDVANVTDTKLLWRAEEPGRKGGVCVVEGSRVLFQEVDCSGDLGCMELREALLLLGDETGGTVKLFFSFLVPMYGGSGGLSIHPEIALLPPRQPRAGGVPCANPGAFAEVAVTGRVADPAETVTVVGGVTAESFRSCVLRKATTLWRSVMDNFLL
jgi:hypothetical protein